MMTVVSTSAAKARGFPAMDDDGLCNPYVVVTLAGHAGITREATVGDAQIASKTCACVLLLAQEECRAG